jgi:exodeoxyribonuclease VII small subunit
MAKSNKLDLETTFSKLDTTIGTFEDDKTTLQESLDAFELGITLTRQAQQKLQEAEQKIEILLEENGKPKAEAFDEPNVG